MNTWIFVDGANAGFITQLKIHFGEDLDWQSDINGVPVESNKVIPVNFSTEHKRMLSHLYLLVNKGYLAIAEKYDKLIVSLRTAYANEYSLDKERTSYDDSLDSLRLALLAYRMTA